MCTPLLGFYGDDFTGSTDAMDALARAGIETVLFLSPPDREAVSELEDVQAVGVAGTSRSITPAEMPDELYPAFRALSRTGVPLIHYKICSTFDSSPHVGSIGRAIDIGADVFEASTVPLLAGAPPLGRYVIFGNMFAAASGDVYRLDRHPTMSEHPVTPMDESDLLVHLSAQTDKELGLLSLLDLRNRPLDAFRESIQSLDVLFLDSLENRDLETVGQLLWEEHTPDGETDRGPAFVVGSSGVEYALAEQWQRTGLVDHSPDFRPLEPVDQTVVLSGSASPVTARQIETAIDSGFVGIRIDTEALVRPTETEAEKQRVITDAVQALDQNRSIVLFTARGPDDPAIERTRLTADELSEAPASVTTQLGTAQGEILRAILAAHPVRRLCIAGGDTCGHVTPSLDFTAIRTRYPLAPGSPVCDALDADLDATGVQVALKGGQLGGPDYFTNLLRGSS